LLTSIIRDGGVMSVSQLNEAISIVTIFETNQRDANKCCLKIGRREIETT
jgi:hypothetical protein